MIDPQLPKEQAGFRRGRSTTDQVTLLTQDIEDSFQAGERAGAIFLDLMAALRYSVTGRATPKAPENHPGQTYGEIHH